MIDFNIDFDIAALIILAIIWFYYCMSQTIRTSKLLAFVMFFWAAVAATVTDIISVLMMNNYDSFPKGLHYLVNQLYYLLMYVAIPVMFYVYISVLRHSSFKVYYTHRIKWVPAIISTLMILSSSVTKWVIYFDDEGIYSYGKLRIYIYVIALFYTLIAMINAVRYRNKLNIKQIVTIYFFSASILISLLIQVLYTELLLAHFAIAITLLLSYLSLENPENYSDSVLDMYNAYAFEEMYTQHFNNRKNFKVLVIKVEELDDVKEAMGTEAVNAIYKDIATYLNGISRKSMAFRIAESTFAIMSKDVSFNWIETTENLIEKFDEPFEVPGSQATVVMAMCMLTCPKKVTKAENMSEMIEYSLAKAPTSGENRLIEADESILEEGRRKNKIVHIMRQAIKEKTFEVYYQPIYSVKQKKYTSAEALIRLNSAELGFISPDEFIPIAEQNGMILDIGEFVFREVCSTISTNKLWEKGIEYIDVNLSVVQCMQESLYKTLLGIMDEYNLKYEFINLEITETTAIMSSDMLKNNMEKLASNGINFSLDDYGTGFSNMSNLIKYTFHTIKLDKSLLWAAMENKKAMYALEHTIAMVKAMEMELVAEGVETLEQAKILEKLGCDFFQGYYYSRPVCKEEFFEKLDNQFADKKITGE